MTTNKRIAVLRRLYTVSMAPMHDDPRFTVCRILRGGVRVAYGEGMTPREAWQNARAGLYNARLPARLGADRAWLNGYNRRYGTAHKVKTRAARVG